VIAAGLPEPAARVPHAGGGPVHREVVAVRVVAQLGLGELELPLIDADGHQRRERQRYHQTELVLGRQHERVERLGDRLDEPARP
jgi:hypothetical protein